MTRAVDLHSKRLARVHQLTGPQLVCLRQIEREAITTPSALAKAVSLSQGTVTGILDRLEARQLVERERSAEDKRKVLVQLTAKGRDLVATAPSPLHEQFSSRLAALPEGEQAMIDWIMQRVVALMEAEGVDAAPMLTTGPVSAEADEVADFLESRRATADDA
jgi:DNA-binding MarR family transcriptional regulator